MSGIIRLLISGLKFAAPASIGYFFNDAATWVGKTFPSTVDPATQGLKLWVKIVLMLAMGILVFFVISALVGKGKKGRSTGMFMFLLSATWLIFGGDSEFVYGTALITLTTGAAVVTSANLTFVPEYLFYAAATQLTGIKITVQGDVVIFDSDANGLTHCGVNRVQGQLTNGYSFRLSNGLITNKNVLFEFTNSAAQTPVIYYDSFQTPSKENRLYLQLLRQTALVGGTDFDNLVTLSLPSMAATDYCNILMKDGTQQSNILRQDLQQKLGYTQNIINTPIYQYDNWDLKAAKINVQVAATQTAYVQRFVKPISDGMIGQAIIAKG